MSINTLESLIQDAYQTPESNKIYDIVENFPKYEKCSIQLLYFEKFCKIPFKLESTSLIYCFGKVIDTLLFYKFFEIDSFSPNSLIDLLNCLIYVNEKILGTNLSKNLLANIEEFMTILLKKDEISEDEKLMIKEMNDSLNYKKYGILETFEDSPDVEEIMFYVKSKHIEDKICGTQKLIQFMNFSKGFEEQLELMAKKLPNIIKYIIQDCYQKDERKIKDLLFELSKLLTTIVGDYEFFININQDIFSNYKKIDSNPNPDMNKEVIQELSKYLYVYIDGKEEMISLPKTSSLINKQFLGNEAIVHYKIINYEDIMRNHENIYSSIALIINTFLLHPNYLDLQELSFKILSKLYIIFPKFRKNLEEPLLTILARISENDVSELKKEISIFLFKITHKYGSQDFLKILENKPNLKSFYKSPYFSDKVLKSSENTLESITPSNLIIKTVFPIEKNVEPGKSYTHIIEVFHPFSIIYIGFATQYYDISFRLKLICLFSQIKNPNVKEEDMVIYTKEAINATKHPCRVVYFAKKPGLYKIEFDNSYSWINNKCIRYKLLVLQPQNLELFMSGESLDNIFEEVKTYESLDKEEQKKLVKKLSMNLNKIVDRKDSNNEKAENQLDRLKLIIKNNEKDSKDIQITVQIELDFLQIIVKSLKAESEWTLGLVNNNNETLDLMKFYSKLNDFFKRKQNIEENEKNYSNEKQILSILFVYNQDAMELFIKRNLKNHNNYNKTNGFKQIFMEIFDFEKNLPKYLDAVYYNFIRDINLFFQTNFVNSQENALFQQLKKKEYILLIYFSQGPKEKNKIETPFIQAFLFDKTNSSNLFQNNLNIHEDLSRSLYDFKENSNLKKRYLEIVNSNERKTEEIINLLEFFLYNLLISYKSKVKLVVFWEVNNANLVEKGFKVEDMGYLKEKLKTRLELYLKKGEDFDKYNEFFGDIMQNFIFDEKCMKSLHEI